MTIQTIQNFHAEFLAFARSKPPEEAYNPSAPQSCGLGQFVASKGYVGTALTYCTKEQWRNVGGGYIGRYSEAHMDAAIPDRSYRFMGQPCTWGALVLRLEALDA